MATKATKILTTKTTKSTEKMATKTTKGTKDLYQYLATTFFFGALCTTDEHG